MFHEENTFEHIWIMKRAYSCVECPPAGTQYLFSPARSRWSKWTSLRAHRGGTNHLECKRFTSGLHSYPGGILSVQLSGNRPQRERPIALVIFSYRPSIGGACMQFVFKVDVLIEYYMNTHPLVLWYSERKIKSFLMYIVHTSRHNLVDAAQ